MSLSKKILSSFYITIVALTSMANDINTGGQSGIVRTLSASTMGKTGINIGGAFKYATDWEYMSGAYEDSLVRKISNGKAATRNSLHLFSGNVYLAYGLGRLMDVSIDCPLFYDISGLEKNVSGFGDLELAVKWGNPFQKANSFINHAYSLKVTFPTGSHELGFFPRRAYYIEDSAINQGVNTITSDGIYFNPVLLWTLDFNQLKSALPLLFHINFGAAITPQKSGSAFLGSVGAEYTPVEILTIFAELTGESRLKYYRDRFETNALNNDPIRLTPGLRFNFPNGIYLIFAGDLGLSDKSISHNTNLVNSGYSYSTKVLPRYGAQFSCGWNGHIKKPDDDRDGVINKLDRCPSEVEDRDGYQDQDGCPDLDNDNDGVNDLKDECPLQADVCKGCPAQDSDSDGVLNENDKCVNEAEDKDGFEDNDGCPDIDNDRDGVIDSLDKCINDAEDKDGFEDGDGCPDLDNDKDGVEDSKDNCPDKAEDSDGFDDGDGCPDLDNDGDGVPDISDKCPGASGLPENSGCPKTAEIKRGKLVLSGVSFMPGKAVLNANSYTILNQVYESLTEWKEVKLEIQGHTDNLGSGAANLALSQARADAVKLYLVNKGVSSDRLRAIGFGKDFPAFDNKTADGREKNRRVELHRND